VIGEIGEIEEIEEKLKYITKQKLW